MTIQQLNLFDYDTLDMETRQMVEQRTAEIKILVRRSAQDIIEIGQKLIEVKAKLGYGKFGKWLRAEFGWSHDTATNFMRVADKFRNFRNLGDFAPSALYLLAAPSTPEEAREEALDLASDGQSITLKLAQQIVEDAKDRRTQRLADALECAPEEARTIALREAVDDPDSIEALSRLHKSNGRSGSNGTFEEVLRSGYVQPGEEDEAVHITDSPLRIAEALRLKSDIHREIEGRHKPKINRAGDEYIPQGFDLCQTPPEALDPLLPFLDPDWTIWEPAAGEGLLVGALYDSGFDEVIATDLLTGQNFFEYEPEDALHDWDCLVTNPPFSLKYKWIERCYALGKAFALLLPVETLGAKTAQEPFRAFGIEVIFMDRRINFKMPNIGFDGSAAQFPVAWFTWGLDIGHQMTFAQFSNGAQE